MVQHIDACGICHEPLKKIEAENGDDAYRDVHNNAYDDRHFFHMGCIFCWIRNSNSFDCPLCTKTMNAISWACPTAASQISYALVYSVCA